MTNAPELTRVHFISRTYWSALLLHRMVKADGATDVRRHGKTVECTWPATEAEILATARGCGMKRVPGPEGVVCLT